MSQVANSPEIFSRPVAREKHWDELPQLKLHRQPAEWSAETFGRQQLHGLVRQLFLTPHDKVVRQVLFSAIDRETYVGSLGQLVGEGLALEKVGSVAVMGRYPQLHGESTEVRGGDGRPDPTALRDCGLRMKENLWLVPNSLADGLSITPRLRDNICGLRREFDYSILEGPVADSHEALAMAQMVDGIVLVLSARYTRRATARNVKHCLESANARILGTVLIDRVFPIPDNIYRRLYQATKEGDVSSLSVPDESAARTNETTEIAAFARLIPGEIAAIGTGARKPPASLGKKGQEKLWNIAEISELPSREDKLAFLLPPPMQSRDAGNWLRLVSADLALVALNWLFIGALLVPMRMVFPHTRIFSYAAGAPLFLVGIALLHGTLITLIGYSGGLYSNTKAGELRDQTRVLANSVLWASGVLAIVFVLQGSPAARAGLLFIAGVLHLATLYLWRRTLLQPRTDVPMKTRNVLIVGGGAAGRRVASYIRMNSHSARSVCGFLDDEMPIGDDVIGRIQDLAFLARRAFIDEVILSAPLDRGLVQRVMREARRLRLDVGIVPELFGCKPTDSVLERMGELSMISVHRELLPGATLACKRVFDALTAGIGLLVLSPAFAIIAVLIKLDSPGTILYRADRAGRKGLPFPCFKFRTMVSDADARKAVLRENNERSGPAFKIADDPRITRVGRWLRRYSLDELPQLWNVLRGEMSLVGPRPHPLDDFAGYEIEHLARLDMTPGMTGLWQVTARRDPSFQRAMELDREYIRRWNLGLDFQILWKTVLAVLQGGGE